MKRFHLPPLLLQYLRYAAASVTSLLVYSLYSIVDGLFVAKGINGYAMSAVNLALPFVNLLFSVAVMFAVGTSTLIAIFLGQNKKQEANRLFTQNTVVLLFIGTLICAVLFIFINPLTRFLGADDITFQYTKDYLSGIAPFSVCFIVSYNMEILIKTDGYPQKALKTVIAGCLMNCILDYICIFPLQMGVFGAALATGISQLFVCMIYLRHFLHHSKSFRFTAFSFDMGIYKRLLPLGISDGITEICTGIMIFVFNRTVQHYLGTQGLEAYTVIAYINTLVINTLIGFSSASQPLVSFHHGKKENNTCRTLLRYALSSSVVFQVLIYILLFSLALPIATAFLGNEEPSLLNQTVSALRLYGISYLSVGFGIITGGYLTSREQPKQAMIISVGRGFLFQTVFLLILPPVFGANAIWFAPVCGEILCFMTSLIFLKQYHKRQDI